MDRVVRLMRQVKWRAVWCQVVVSSFRASVSVYRFAVLMSLSDSRETGRERRAKQHNEMRTWTTTNLNGPKEPQRSIKSWLELLWSCLNNECKTNALISFDWRKAYQSASWKANKISPVTKLINFKLWTNNTSRPSFNSPSQGQYNHTIQFA